MRPTERELRQEIIQVCQMLHARNYVAASDGNVSARLDDGTFLCTPSGFMKGLLRPDQLLVISEQAEVVGSSRFGPTRGLKPSSEIWMHLECYRQRSDALSVVHAHPPTAISLSIAGVSLARCLLPEVVMTLGLIPTTEYATPGSPEGAGIVRDLIQSYDALVLQRHGTVAVGESPLAAYMKTEKVEHTAHITLNLLQIGSELPFPAEQIKKTVDWRANRGLLRGTQATDLCETCSICHLVGHCPVEAH